MGSIGPYELNTIILGDCLEAMGPIPDNSVDSILCDPPYGLSKEPDMVEVLTHWLNGDDYTHRGGGFMGRNWDSFVPGPAIWRECYRVLKPGGCLMAFGGTRTCDLLSIAIRLAGFQRFDQVVWIHGQGFGKGADISKKIDAMAGAEREVIGETIRVDGRIPANEKPQNLNGNIYQTGIKDSSQRYITAPATEAAALWSGWRSQLKPSHEVILCFWKPREKSFAHNALKYGVAGLNIDECRIGTEDNTGRKTGRLFAGMDTPGGICGGETETHPSGRYPANVLLSHHESCVRVGVKRVRGSNYADPEKHARNESGVFLANGGQYKLTCYADPDGYESVPDYRCHPDCPVRMLDEQAGVRKSGGRSGKPGNGMFLQNAKDVGYAIEASIGSASRFFYCPKAPPREKWFYCEICDDVFPYAQRDDHAHGKPKGKRKHQIAHPTVKPIAINNYLFGVLEYLCRLTKTPTGGIVLDPFGGSGTTALAAMANGRQFLLIENDSIYHRIAQKRIEQALKEPHQLKLL